MNPKLLAKILAKTPAMETDGHMLYDLGGPTILLVCPKKGNEYLLKQTVVSVCGEYFYKYYPKKRFIYKPKQVEKAVGDFRESVDHVIGVSGYSIVNEARCSELGIKLGQYEEATVGLVGSGILSGLKDVPKARVAVATGAAERGVDLAVENMAIKLGLKCIGTSCLKYLWHVVPALTYKGGRRKRPKVLIARTEADYCVLYISLLDQLLAANGGPVAYDMDVYAATKTHTIVVPVDVLGSLGAHVSPWKPGPAVQSRRVKYVPVVNDAVGALFHSIRPLDLKRVDFMGGGSVTERLRRGYGYLVSEIFRQNTSAKVGYGLRNVETQKKKKKKGTKKKKK